MKKTLVALAALAATASFAQSNVTLYGQVGVAYGPFKTNAVLSSVAGGVVTPVLDSTRSTSGMRSNDISASRWGFRGSEDLGGGMRATFNLESGFGANDGSGFGGGGNGTTGNIFTRRSVVGIGGGFGEVSFGRELTPAVFIAGGYDVDGIETFSTTQHLGQAITINGFNGDGFATNLGAFRRSNAINYVSNDLNGFVVRAQIANNKSKGANNLSGGTTTTTDSGDNGSGLSVNYANGPMAVGFAIDQGKSTNAGAGRKFSGWFLGGSYDFGSVKLMGNFSQVNVKDITFPTDLGDNLKTKQWNIGAQVPMGALTFLASIGRNNLSFDDGVANPNRSTATASGTDFMLGVNYSMSKRTTVYARTGVINKFSGDFFTNGVRDGTFSNKSSGTVVGLRHTF